MAEELTAGFLLWQPESITMKQLLDRHVKYPYVAYISIEIKHICCDLL